MTNFHVVRGSLNETINLSDKHGNLASGKVIAAKDLFDLAIIELDNNYILQDKVELEFDATRLKKGENLIGFGNGGHNFFWGSRAVYKHPYQIKWKADGFHRQQDFNFIGYQFRAGLIGGHSGSPMVDSNLKVRAILNMGSQIEGTNIGIPAAYALDLYKDALYFLEHRFTPEDQ